MSSIPYDPSLELANIVPEKKLDILKQIAANFYFELAAGAKSYLHKKWYERKKGMLEELSKLPEICGEIKKKINNMENYEEQAKAKETVDKVYEAAEKIIKIINWNLLKRKNEQSKRRSWNNCKFFGWY